MSNCGDNWFWCQRGQGRKSERAAMLAMGCWLSCCLASVFGAPPSQSELASFLSAAEESRGWFRIHMVHRYEYLAADNGTTRKENSLDVLTDGQGQLRTSYLDTRDGQVQTVVWGNGELRTLTERVVDGNPLAQQMTMSETFPRYHMTDSDLWAILGLMLDYPVSEKTPLTRVSEVLADKTQSVEISEEIEDGKVLVKVLLRDPFKLGPGAAEFSFHFDPTRDWLMVRSNRDNPGPTSERYSTRFNNEVRVVESEEIDGVWMPTQVQDIQIFRYADKPAESYEATIMLSQIQLRPEVSAADFTIRVSDLQDGASVVDNRLGISYKIGENLVYMDGHLNEVAEPIWDEITPDELKRIMKDAVAYIDSVAVANESKLSPVQVKGRLARLSTWGFGLMGLGLATFGIIIWRRSQVA